VPTSLLNQVQRCNNKIIWRNQKLGQTSHHWSVEPLTIYGGKAI